MKKSHGEISMITLLAPAMTALILLSCGHKKEIAASPEVVKVVRAEKGAISQTVLLTGSIEAEDFAEIYPRAPGKVVKKLLSEGDKVKKNQPIILTLQDEVGYTFKPAPVVSKIGGFVGRIYVDVGATVSPSLPVATVVNPERMRIKIDVPEAYLPAMKIGTDVGFSTGASAGEKFTGTISSVSKEIDLKSRTGRVELSVPNEGQKLVHGMFVKLDMPVAAREDAVIVPATAVSWEADSQFVFKVVNGRAVRSEVKVGIRNNAKVEIMEGAAEGDVIISGDLVGIADGEEVKIE